MRIIVTKDRNVLNTKFLAMFVNGLAEMGHDVYLLCDSYNKLGEGVELAPTVRFINLSQTTGRPLNDAYIKLRKHLSINSFRFQRAIKEIKPDIIVCYFLKDLFNVLFLQKKTAPVVLMMHNYPPVVFDRLKKKSSIRQKTYKKLIESVDAIQVLNKSFEDTVRHYYDVKKITTIGNAVEQIPEKKRANLDKPKNKIIYIGRIAKEGKRQHLLIEAFAKIAKEFPDWTVEFWGLQKYSSYNQELRDLIQNYKLEKQVFLKGYSHNIQEEYRQADINAFPSLHEGFGLGLADGMAMGLPSIGFDYTPSVNELIRDGENGFLVSDINTFAEKLKTLMSDKSLRIRLGRQAAQDMQQFKPQRIHDQWMKLLEFLCRRAK